MIRYVTLVVLLGLTACGGSESPPKSAAAAPLPLAHRSRPSWQMDPDIERIFGPNASTHTLPRQLQWSPDSHKVAYVRTPTPSGGSSGTELWMYDLHRDVEVPLLTGEDVEVSEYDWVDASRIAAISNEDVWLIPLGSEKLRLTRTRDKESQVLASPDGTKIAFLRNHNIILLDLISMLERPLTTEGHAKHTFGEVTWLYAEEFDTDTGFGWSPKSDRLWFYETFLSKVPFRGIPLADGSIKAMAYPRPGEPNPEIRIGIFDITNSAMPPVYVKDGRGKDVYLPKVSWHPNNDQLFIVQLDRLQTSLSFISCTVSTLQCAEKVKEDDPRYVNLQDGPVSINSGKELLRVSERSGYAHIQRVRLDTLSETPLTAGKYEVSVINHVDEKRGRVIFTANPEDTGEHKLYAVSLFGGEVMTLPQTRGNHEAIFSPDGDYFVDTHSSLERPPRIEIKTRDGETVTTLAETFLPKNLTEDVTNEIFPFDSFDGLPIMAHLTRPAVLSPDTRYPVLVIVYGGPHAQLAKNAFHTTYQPWRQLLAKRGILVFTVDGRGSFGRGHLFESAIRGQLGNIELKDQLAGIAHLKTLPFVDPKRFGIFGWSYGGYMALNAVLRTKNIFNVCVSVAPVTNWRYYDTAYTERYMQRPEDNPEGYRNTALPPLASRLDTPLLLVHGMADDNVHLINSQKMLEAFIASERFITPLFYPGKNHKIEGPGTRVHLFTQITRFIEDNL